MHFRIIKRGVFLLSAAALVVILLFSSLKLYQNELRYKTAQDSYNRLQNTMTSSSPSDENASGYSAEDEESMGTSEDQPDQAPVSVDCASLKKQNRDFAGWFYMEGIGASYPVVFCGDNETYLHKTFDGTANYAGCLFIDGNIPYGDFTDPYTIIYGHNMKNRSMFGALKDYLNEGRYKTNRYFWIITSNDVYRYTIFSIRITDTSDDAYTLSQDANDNYQERIREWNASSSVNLSMPAYDEDSKIVTLSTCYGSSGTSYRLIVQGITSGT